MKNLALAVAFWVALFATTFGGSAAWAATIFADAVNGNDFIGDGSSAMPYRTLTMAMGAASSGDVITLRDGVYNDANGEVFPIVMRPGVSVTSENGTLSTVVSPDDDTAFLFVYGNFDATSSIRGLSIRGGSIDTYSGDSAIVIDGAAYGGYVTGMSPVIDSNIIENWDTAVEIDTSAVDFFPVDVSPVITNNIIRGFDEYGVDAEIDNGDTATIAVENNLIEGADSDSDTYGFYLFAEGGDSTNDDGATATVTLHNNVFNRTYYGMYFFAENGEDVIPGPGKQQLSAMPFTTGGKISATITNNVVNTSFQNEGMAIYAYADGYDSYGGSIDLTIARNEFRDYYGIFLEAGGSYSPYQGGQISAVIRDNAILSTDSDPGDDGAGVFALAGGGEADIDLSISGNRIESYYGVFMEADGSRGSSDFSVYSVGGHIEATITGNIIDSSVNGEDEGYGIFAEGFFASPSNTYRAYGPDSGGRVDLEVHDNAITAEYGVFLESDGVASSYAFDGGSGIITADVQHNEIVGISRYNFGYGMFVFADDASVAANGQTGGVVELNVENNTIRGYYGMYMFQSTNGTASLNGTIDANIVNNTIIGGGLGAFYDAGAAVYLDGGTAAAPFNPTLANNILSMTSFANYAVVYSDDVDATPAVFNNNLINPGINGYPTYLLGMVQGDEAAVNALGFADANIVTNPGFVCPNQMNFDLRDTSAAIDAGSAAYAPADDIVGNPRDASPDIGAYEFQGASGPIFQDVGLDHIFYPYITAIFNAGITGGCQASPRLYCPTLPISREQMAVFLIRAMNEAPDFSGAPLFADVVPAAFSYGFVQRLAQLGITNGCSPGLYCPLAPVTRAQMSAFILKALGEGPALCAGTFADVTAANPFCGWIEKLAALGITSGCGPGVYCPDDPVTRGQMAVFIAKAFDLMLPASCGGINPPRIAGGPKDGLVEGALGVDETLLNRPEGLAEHEVLGGSSPLATRRGIPVPAVVTHAAGATEAVQLARPGLPAEVARAANTRALDGTLAPGPVGHVGPVPNDKLRVRPGELEAAILVARGHGAASVAADPAGAVGKIRLTRDQKRQLKDAVAARVLALKEQGVRRIDRGLIRKQEKARITGRALDADREAARIARSAAKNDKILNRPTSAQRAAERDARRAAWKAKLGNRWPDPGKRVNRAPGALPGAPADSGRTR